MADTPTPTRITGELEFHFEKANSFRVIHVDGAFGGVSPGSRLIHMAVFSERTPLPKMVVHLAENGVLGAEVMEKRVTKSGIFPELCSCLTATLKTVRCRNRFNVPTRNIYFWEDQIRLTCRF